MPSEPLCDVCYFLTGGRDMMHTLRSHVGDVCTRCHARRECGNYWNRSSALVSMHDALTTASVFRRGAEVLCDQCRGPVNGLDSPRIPNLGDECVDCGAVYVQDRDRAIEDLQIPGTNDFVTKKFLIPGWRPKTALEAMKEALDDDAL